MLADVRQATIRPIIEAIVVKEALTSGELREAVGALGAALARLRAAAEAPRATTWS